MITIAGLNEIKEALDVLGVALTDHQHQWTQRQRELYEKATATIFLEEVYLTEAETRNKCPGCGRNNAGIPTV